MFYEFYLIIIFLDQFFYHFLRIAKRKLDDRPFFGSLLEVSYAPQYESVADVSNKLEERIRTVNLKYRSRKVKKSQGKALLQSSNPSCFFIPVFILFLYFRCFLRSRWHKRTGGESSLAP